MPVKKKNHGDVRVWGSDDSVLINECGGVVELKHYSRICLILVAVEREELLHLDLNCKKKH